MSTPSDKPARSAIALGTNLGNRILHLQVARDALKKLAVSGSEFLQSAIYQSSPVDCPGDSPDFYNCVVEFSYSGSPYHLLDATQSIECHLGRTPSDERNSPRIIDLDILYLGQHRETGGILELPHPRLISRRFVLQPLAEIAPQFILPGDTATIAEQLAHFDSDEAPLALVQSAW